MECGEARKILYLNSGVESLTGELVEAKRHIKHCAKCCEFFREEEILKNLIRERAPREKANSNLREHILSEIAKKREKKLIKHLSFIFASEKINKYITTALMVLILIVLTSLLLYITSINKENTSLASRLAEDHIRNIPDAVEISASQPKRIEDWFKGKVDFLVKVPNLYGATLRGARLCHIGKKRVALLNYEKDKKPISLFIMEESFSNQSSRDEFEIYNKQIRHRREKGLNLLYWENSGVTYVLVSDIKLKELLNLTSKTALIE